jgi:Zn-dependent protease with chaperone function
MCATAAALVLDRIPALRGLAGLHAPMTVESVPFLLACGYLTFRILYPVHLVAARAMEREADREMVKLTADPDGCIEAMTAIFTILGAPVSTSLPQRLLFATHPSAGERLSFFRRTADLSAAPLAAQAAESPD